MTDKPLVSICTTYYNAERYLHRVFDSCLAQTYGNIELIVVDDASTDGSEEIVRGYMARDSRVKYFRNDTRVRVTESWVRMFRYSKGDLVMMIGADDWLARDYIEHGVRTFLAYPDCAGVIPQLVSLRETVTDAFTLLTLTHRRYIPPKARSAAWFLKRLYRPRHLYVSTYALMRREDMVTALDYYVRHFTNNQSPAIPAKLKDDFHRGFGTDSMFFPEIFRRRTHFVFDSAMRFLKVEHGENQYFEVRRNSPVDIFRSAYVFLTIYSLTYKPEWPALYGGMKVHRAAHVFSTVYIDFLRGGLHPSFFRFTPDLREILSEFFIDYTRCEIALALVESVPMALARCIAFLLRRVFKVKKPGTRAAARVFVRENFLTPDGRFLAN
jgi:glycosyltransferase involved in cell wall biosynthesis